MSTSSKGPNGSPLLAMTWHILALSVFTFAFQRLDSLSAISGFDITEQFGGHFQFLTNWGLWISRLAMGLALINDMVPQITQLRIAKAAVCVAALPMETLISLLYWGILTLNSDLLFPPKQVADPNNPAQLIKESIRLPLTTDLSLHAAPALFLLIVSLACISLSLVEVAKYPPQTFAGLSLLLASILSQDSSDYNQRFSDDRILVRENDFPVY
jgi:hypothetical protein